MRLRRRGHGIGIPEQLPDARDTFVIVFVTSARSTTDKGALEMAANDEAFDSADLGVGAYGEVLACYAGRGTLSSDKHTGECRFAAAQLRDGDIVVLCDFVQPAHGLPFALFAEPS